MYTFWENWEIFTFQRQIPIPNCSQFFPISKINFTKNAFQYISEIQVLRVSENNIWVASLQSQSFFGGDSSHWGASATLQLESSCFCISSQMKALNRKFWVAPFSLESLLEIVCFACMG